MIDKNDLNLFNQAVIDAYISARASYFQHCYFIDSKYNVESASMILTINMINYSGDFTTFHKKLCDKVSSMIANPKGPMKIGLTQLWVNQALKNVTYGKKYQTLKPYINWKRTDLHQVLDADLLEKIVNYLGESYRSVYEGPLLSLEKYEDYLYIQAFLKNNDLSKSKDEPANEKFTIIKSEDKVIKQAKDNLVYAITDTDAKLIGGLVPEKDEKYYSHYVYYPAFSNQLELKKVIISENVKEIGSKAFLNCYNLREIQIQDGLSIIDSFAFEGCVSLEKITIPKTVKNIGSLAFKGCNSLTKIIFYGVTIYPILGAIKKNTFEGLSPNLIIHFLGYEATLKKFYKDYDWFFKYN